MTLLNWQLFKKQKTPGLIWCFCKLRFPLREKDTEDNTQVNVFIVVDYTFLWQKPGRTLFRQVPQNVCVLVTLLTF